MSCKTHKPTTAHMEIQSRKKSADWHWSKGLHFHKHGDSSDRRGDSITFTLNNKKNNKKPPKHQQLQTMTPT